MTFTQETKNKYFMSGLEKGESSLENEEPNIIFNIAFVMINTFLWGHLFSCTSTSSPQEALSVYFLYGEREL